MGPKPRSNHREVHFHRYILKYAGQEVSAHDLSIILSGAVIVYVSGMLEDLRKTILWNLGVEIQNLVSRLSLDEAF